MESNYLFTEINEINMSFQKFTKKREIILKRMWWFRIIYFGSFFLIVGLGWLYGLRVNLIDFLGFVLVCWLVPYAWYETVVIGTEIKDYTVIKISSSDLIIEKLSRCAWSPKSIIIPLQTIRKIIIDGKSNMIIIQNNSNNQIKIKKSRGYLKTYFFQSRGLENLIKALKKLQIKYEVVYP